MGKIHGLKGPKWIHMKRDNSKKVNKAEPKERSYPFEKWDPKNEDEIFEEWKRLEGLELL